MSVCRQPPVEHRPIVAISTCAVAQSQRNSFSSWQHGFRNQLRSIDRSQQESRMNCFGKFLFHLTACFFLNPAIDRASAQESSKKFSKSPVEPGFWSWPKVKPT